MNQIEITCEQILKKDLSERETGFIKSIKSKVSISEKQEKWLRSIAKSNYIEIQGKIKIKKKRKPKEIIDCEHDDLGSLGYTHGENVTCPNCGRQAVVW